jgi:hypothetical protein
MGASCCGHDAKFEGLSADYKRRLWLVIAINATMFLVEMGAGALAGSRALQADALDFLGDTLTYGMSLAVIGATIQVRAWTAFAKGLSLTVMGLWVFGTTAYHVLVLGVPKAEVMGVVGFLALGANLASVLVLAKYKDGDANVRSVWLCSRNDAIGNVADDRGRRRVGHGNEMARPDRGGDHGRAVPVVLVPDPAPVVAGTHAERRTGGITAAWHTAHRTVLRFRESACIADAWHKQGRGRAIFAESC